ncbi:MAG: hypothetical protein ACOY37_04270 [Pseudomonadota bacterium]
MTENFAIERLSALLNAGYEIECASADAVTLRHPATRATGFVYPNGLTVVTGGEGEARFHSDSPQADFLAFVRMIPKPGWRRTVRIPEWLVAGATCALAVLLIAWTAG